MRKWYPNWDYLHKAQEETSHIILQHMSSNKAIISTGFQLSLSEILIFHTINTSQSLLQALTSINSSANFLKDASQLPIYFITLWFLLCANSSLDLNNI